MQWRDLPIRYAKPVAIGRAAICRVTPALIVTIIWLA
jgi:hypothetical protein